MSLGCIGFPAALVYSRRPISTKETMFTACAACTFLKNLLDETPRGQPEILAAIRKRLGAGDRLVT